MLLSMKYIVELQQTFYQNAIKRFRKIMLAAAGKESRKLSIVYDLA